MRRVRNPFKGQEGYNCFGCSPDNLHGLQMNFLEEGDEMICSWDPKSHFQGFRNILHGGIQSTLMDEIASWTVYVKLKRSGVTAKMDIHYLKPVYLDLGTLTIRAHVHGMRRHFADIMVKLYDSKEQLCSEGMITYFTIPPEKSKETYNYPGYSEFFES